MAAAQPFAGFVLAFQPRATFRELSHDGSVGTAMVRPPTSLIESMPIRPAGFGPSIVVLVASTAIRFSPGFSATATFMV